MVHSAEYHLRDLTIKSVTLGPQRATVICEMQGVPIKVSDAADFIVNSGRLLLTGVCRPATTRSQSTAWIQMSI
jgi:hypothetical protein